mmetsp:Transcript_122915/g.274459  ORF Transcript_122915/g.274459 Transcript_122915/m.274459 type:complete len:210 (+) Transcript_122915:893-1522(+)
MRIRQPPENWITGRSIEKRSSSGAPFVKPRPHRILRTCDSFDSAPVASRSAATVSSSERVLSMSSAEISSPASVAFSISSSFLRSSSSLDSKDTVFSSAASTSCTAVLSLALASCSTRMTSQFRGTGISRAAMCRKIVVFPMPLGPRMPYLLPCTIVMEALSKSVCPGAERVKLSHTKASPEGGGSFLPPSSVRVNAAMVPTGSSSSFL